MSMVFLLTAIDHAGIRFAQSSKLLATNKVPPVSFNTMKQRELEVGPHLLQAADNSCAAALQAEEGQNKENHSRLVIGRLPFL